MVNRLKAHSYTTRLYIAFACIHKLRYTRSKQSTASDIRRGRTRIGVRKIKITLKVHKNVVNIYTFLSLYSSVSFYYHLIVFLFNSMMLIFLDTCLEHNTVFSSSVSTVLV